MANKISGTGNSATRLNEITADDLATMRSFLIGFSNGVLTVGDTINVNEVNDVIFTINNDGELIVNEPIDYQGTIFSRVDNELFETTASDIQDIKIKRIDNYLIAEGGIYFE